jgi:hypothetical protein
MRRRLVKTILAFLLLIPLVAEGRSRAVKPLPRIQVSDEAAVSGPSFGLTFRAYGPRIAIGPEESLILWNGGDQLARITDRGELIDVPSIERPQSSGLRRDTAEPMWLSDHFLVAESICVGCTVPPFGPWQWSLTITTIRPDGSIIASKAIDRIASGDLAAATNGRATVVYAGGETFSFNADGRLRARTLVTRAASSAAAMASDGDGYFVVWTVGNIIEGLHLDADGRPVEPTPLLIAAGSEPSVVWDGRGYAMVYVNGQSIDLTHIENGTVGFAVRIYTSKFGAVRPSLAWNGSEYGLAWKEVTADYPRQCFTFGGGDVGLVLPCAPVDLMMARVAPPDGRATGVTTLRRSIDLHERPLPTDVIHLTARGRDFVITWSEAHTDDHGHDVYSLLWPAGGDAGLPRLISQKSLDQGQHSVVQHGDGFLVAWAEGDASEHAQSLRLARFGSSGERISTGQTVAEDINGGPVIASGPGGAFVVWIEGTSNPRVLAARIDDGGSVPAGTPVEVARGNYLGNVDIACGVSDCLVVWDDSRTHGRRLSPAGAVLDAGPIEIAGQPHTSVVWNGESYMVVTSGPGKLSGTIVRDGHPATPFTIYAAPFSPFPSFPHSATGCNAEKCLLITDAGHTALIDHEGTVVTGPTLIGPGPVTSVAWNGRTFIAAMSPTCDVDVALFNSDGELLGTGLTVAATSDCESLPAIAIGRDGRAFVAYERLSSSSRSTRLYYRLVQ